MKKLTLAAFAVLAFGVSNAHAQSASEITIVSEPSQWYSETDQGFSPSAEALIEYPHLTSVPGPIPEHWHVTRLDPWTQVRVLNLEGQVSVVTWGSSRVLPNWHEYRTPFSEMSHGESSYTRHHLPVGHAMHAEFHMADVNRDGKITAREHNAFFNHAVLGRR